MECIKRGTGTSIYRLLLIGPLASGKTTLLNEMASGTNHEEHPIIQTLGMYNRSIFIHGYKVIDDKRNR
jgi:GTPase SAR1 family protein